MAMESYFDPTSTEVKIRIMTDNPNVATVEITRKMVGLIRRLKAAPNITPGSPGTWAAVDREILFNTPIEYYVIIRDAAGVVVETDTGGPVTVTNNSAYLRDVLITSNRLAVRLVGPEAGDYQTDVRRELLRPLGKKTPVVITDVRSASTGSTSILTMTNAEQQSLRRLLDSGQVLMFQGPASWDMNWPLYVHFGAVECKRVGTSLSEHRLWNLEWIEVDPPPIGLYTPIPAKRWMDLRDTDTQWADIYTGSWLDILYPLTRRALEAA